MLIDRVMQRLTYSSLVITFFLAVASQSAIAKSMTNHAQISPDLTANNAIKVAQNPSEIDEKAAVKLIEKLPQVKRKAREIERLSRGTIRVATMLESSPTPETPYYTIRVVENHVDHVDTIYLFRVFNPGGEIRVYDILKDDYISLPDWQPN
ncbi:hypothetical protein NIES22_03850 [Calothrix brevissima NIES-22]|nr:hypothetical protein NIES22_03850 [Calothrix brevissima NIES-22]